METPIRSGNTASESVFHFDPHSLLASQFDESGTTPQQARSSLNFWAEGGDTSPAVINPLHSKGNRSTESAGALSNGATATIASLFRKGGATMFDTTPQRLAIHHEHAHHTTSSGGVGMHADDDMMMSPDPFSGRSVPSVAGLSAGGTTNSRSAARTVYSDEGSYSVGRAYCGGMSGGGGYHHDADVMLIMAPNEGNTMHSLDALGSVGGGGSSSHLLHHNAGTRGRSSSIDGAYANAECQLLLDNSSDGSEQMECPIDIDDLVKITPSDAKKHEPVFHGHQLKNNGRLDMTHDNEEDSYRSGGRYGGGNCTTASNTNGGRSGTARAVPVNAFVGPDGRVGDSPAKLTASELRRLARQQQGGLVHGPVAVGISPTPSPTGAPPTVVTATSTGAVVVDTINGRRLPNGTAITTALVAAPNTTRQVTTVAAHTLPGNAVELLQPTSRRVAPPSVLTAANVARPTSAATTSSVAAPSPTASAAAHDHDESCDSVVSTSRPMSSTINGGGGSLVHHARAASSSSLNALTASSSPTAAGATTTPTAPIAVSAQAAAIVNNGGLVTAVLEFKMGRKVRCRCPVAIAQKVQGSNTSVFLVMQSDHTGTIDAGICSQIYTAAEKSLIPRSLGLMDQGTVLRIASDDDCDLINNTLPDLEERAMQECHELIHFLHLPFVCVDVEATFDQTAIKVFYSITSAVSRSSSNVPNVSRLQRELACKLRLKVVFEQCNSDNTTTSSNAEAALSSSGRRDSSAHGALPPTPLYTAPSTTTVTMRAVHTGIPTAATAGLGQGATLVQPTSRRLPPAFVMPQSTAGASSSNSTSAPSGPTSAFTVVGGERSAPVLSPPSSLPTRATSTMSFAVSATTASPSSVVVQPSPISYEGHHMTMGAGRAPPPMFACEPISRSEASSFVVTANASERRFCSGAPAYGLVQTNGPAPAYGHGGRYASAAAPAYCGTNANAAPWMPGSAPTPVARSSCTSPRPESSSNATPIHTMPVASSRRTVPTNFVTNVQATSDSVTYNGTCYAGASGTATPVTATSRPSSSAVYTAPTNTVSSSSAMMMGSIPRSGAQTPSNAYEGSTSSQPRHGGIGGRHSSAVSRTPSVVSHASPSEASNDDYPVPSSRRRVYRQ